MTVVFYSIVYSKINIVIYFTCSWLWHKNVPYIQVHTFFQNNTIFKNKGIKTLPYILSLEKGTTYSAFLKYMLQSYSAVFSCTCACLVPVLYLCAHVTCAYLVPCVSDNKKLLLLKAQSISWLLMPKTFYTHAQQGIYLLL